MADYSFLNVVTVDGNNKKRNRKITYIRPDASREELTDFVRAMGALSEDSLYKVQRVIKNSIDTKTAEDADVFAYINAILANNFEPVDNSADFVTYMSEIFDGTTAPLADTDFADYIEGIFTA